MYAARPVVYTTSLGYDEEAHQQGIERAETRAVLRQVDRQLGRIAAAAERAPRPYRLVVLSDHGQSQGATFLDRYGLSLEDLVEKEVDAGTEEIAGPATEAPAFLGASLAEASSGDSRKARMLRRVSRGRVGDGD